MRLLLCVLILSACSSDQTGMGSNALTFKDEPLEFKISARDLDLEKGVHLKGSQVYYESGGLMVAPGVHNDQVVLVEGETVKTMVVGQEIKLLNEAYLIMPDEGLDTDNTGSSKFIVSYVSGDLSVNEEVWLYADRNTVPLHYSTGVLLESPGTLKTSGDVLIRNEAGSSYIAGSNLLLNPGSYLLFNIGKTEISCVLK